MSNQWYLHIQGETIGPIGTEVVGALLRCARLMPSDFLWSQGMASWERAGNLRAFALSLPAVPAVPVPLPPLPEASMPVKAFERAMTEAIELHEGGEQATKELRRFWVLRMVRVRIDAVAHVHDRGSFPAYDLSESGIFLVAESPIPVGSSVRFNLESSDFVRPLELAGAVARIGLSAGGQKGFAIRFDGIAASERHLIRELVKEKHVKPRIL